MLTYTFISIFYVQYKAYKVLILTVKLSEIVFEFNIIKMTCLVNLTLFSRKKIHAKLYDLFFQIKVPRCFSVGRNNYSHILLIQ